MSSSGGWSSWLLDRDRSNNDVLSWHVYRGHKDGDGNWVYERKAIPRDLCPTAEDSLALAESQTTTSAAGQSSGKQKAQGTRNGNRNPFATNGTYKVAVASWAGNAQASSSNATGSGSGYAFPTGGVLSDPRLIGRSQTTMPMRYSRGSGVANRSGLGLEGFEPISKVNQRQFFRSGRVFRAPHTESTDYGARSMDEIFSEVLRFMVVRPHRRHSLCIAIHTYSGRGSIGQRVRDHMIIHTSEKPPAPLPDEDLGILLRKPVRMQAEPPDEDVELHPASRLHLSKMYTVDHKTPVRNVGRISQRSANRIRDYCLELQGMIAGGGFSAQLAGGAESDDDRRRKRK